MNVLEGVDTSAFNNMAIAYMVMILLFVILPGLIGMIIGRLLKLRRKGKNFVVSLCVLVGFYIWFSNIDIVFKWFS